ncbi:MAG: hypothetical protein WKF44_02530 [Rubrobacteraceae bacterium]
MTDPRNSAEKGPRTLVTSLPQILLLAVFILLVAGCAQAQSPSSAEKEQPSKQPQKQTSEKSSEPSEKNSAAKEQAPKSGKLGHPTLGDADAPVVMTNYSDYQ